MNKEYVINKIINEKIIVVTRGIYDEELLRLAYSMVNGGITMFEITYDPAEPRTKETIYQSAQCLKNTFGSSLTLGIGTVLNEELVDSAYKAGAEFIVSPNLNLGVIKKTKEYDLVSIPGCMTPTEICMADDAGADFIKLFPAGTLGLKYCKDVYAPIHHVRFIATVGITEQSFEDYLKIGFTGAGISSRLTDKKMRDLNRFDELTDRARRFVEIAKRYK